MANDPKDYYGILGVKRHATEDEIQKAYLKLAKKYHPDANPRNPEAAEARMKEINEAKSILLDTGKRREYDSEIERAEEARRAAENERAWRAEETRRAAEGEKAWRAEELKRAREAERSRKAEEAELARLKAVGWGILGSLGELLEGIGKVVCGCAVGLIVVAGIIVWLIIHSSCNSQKPSYDYEDTYEECVGQTPTYSSSDIRDIDAKIRALGDKIVKQQEELKSTTNVKEKRRLLDAHIETCESALKLMETADNIIQSGIRGGRWTEKDCREFLEAFRYARPILMNRIAETKKQRSEL